MEWEVVVGLEVHSQLLTETKIFCGCSTAFGAPPNTHVCPVCLGLPGALPVLNEKVVDYAIRVGLATDCTIARESRFARKNYFYPDLPKGYQISQFELPILEHGHLDITDDAGNLKRIGITRIHMEEDAGKLLHPETPGADYSLVDLNRACTPLLECVSEPDIRSAGEAVRYAKKYREILVYLGVCDGNMNEGSLRVDANVSVRPKGQEKLGTRAEIKNVNSFKFLEQAIEYERERQIELIESGGTVVQETRLFDPERGVTKSMRSKEEAHDYRYFPDPDLLPLVIDEARIEAARAALPELPEAKRARYKGELDLPAHTVEVLTQEAATARYFDEAAAALDAGSPTFKADARGLANWIAGPIAAKMKEGESPDYRIAPATLAAMQRQIGAGTLSNNLAKTVVLDALWGTGKTVEEVMSAEGIGQEGGDDGLEAIVDEILAANPAEVEGYRGGKTKLMGFFVGQIMRKSQGKADPARVNDLLKKKLG